jgi:hypothetical protein
MTLLDTYRALVDQLEWEESPNGPGAARSLVDEVYAAAWRTPEERSAAQALIARLERLIHSGPGQAPEATTLVA